MTPSFCRSCGHALKSGAAFCASCGERVAPVEPAASPRPPAPPPTQPAPATASGHPPRRRAPYVLLLVALVLVFLTVGAGTAYVLTSDDADERADGPTGERSGDLEVLPIGIGNGISVLEEPDGEWDLRAAEVIDGGLFHPMTNWDGDGQTQVPDVLTFGDVAVAHVVSEDDDVLVGVSTADGSVRWEHAEGAGRCSSADGVRLLCSGRDGEGLTLLDPATGEVLARSEESIVWATRPAYDDGVLYLATGGIWIDAPMAVTAMDAEDLTVRWSTEPPIFDGFAVDSAGVSYHEGTVSVVVSDYDGLTPGSAVLDAGTGEVVDSFEHDYDTVLDDGWLVDQPVAEPVEVRSLDGHQQLVAYGDVWWSPAEGAVVDGRIGVGGSLYDLATGEVVWSRDDLDGESVGWEWTPGHRHVVAGDYSGDQTYSTFLDAGTGDEVWSGHVSLTGAAYTGDAAVTIEYDDPAELLVVRSLEDGEVRWSREVSDLYDPDAADDFTSFLGTQAVAQDAVLAIGSDVLRGYVGFPEGSATGDEDDQDDQDDQDGTAYTTACGTPPAFVPVGSAAANGGITITYEVRATCPGGQWLNLSQLRVPFSVALDGAAESYVYADGYFDFADHPTWVPEEGVELDLVYPYDQTQVPADDIADAIEEDGGTGDVVHVPCEPGPDNVDGAVPSDPGYGADPDVPTTADGAPDQDETPDQRDESALAALRRIAAEDAAAVEQLDWTAQLSSKKPGTYDDGMVYDSYDDILALHLQLRAAYPESLLVFSSDWPGTYGPSSQDYWVTLSGGSDPTTRPVLQWCRDEGRGAGDCWAVRVRRTGNPDRNVDHAPPDVRNN